MRKDFASKYEKYMIAMRREFHQYPELSAKERRTSKRICEELEKLSIPYEIAGCNNIIGYLEG